MTQFKKDIEPLRSNLLYKSLIPSINKSFLELINLLSSLPLTIFCKNQHFLVRVTELFKPGFSKTLVLVKSKV